MSIILASVQLSHFLNFSQLFSTFSSISQISQSRVVPNQLSQTRLISQGDGNKLSGIEKVEKVEKVEKKFRQDLRNVEAD